MGYNTKIVNKMNAGIRKRRETVKKRRNNKKKEGDFFRFLI
jgi:hypothetical protein